MWQPEEGGDLTAETLHVDFFYFVKRLQFLTPEPKVGF
jgi:hypothetical protein